MTSGAALDITVGRADSLSPARRVAIVQARGRALVIGLKAAWLAPRAIDRSLATLLVPMGDDGVHAACPPEMAVAMARRALSLLSRIPGGRWRRTCLYSSVAECLALRAAGHGAKIVIGVGTTGAGRSSDVIAHAWVERADLAAAGPVGGEVASGTLVAGAHAAGVRDSGASKPLVRLSR